MGAAMLSSCSKNTSTTPSAITAQLNIINVSPDLYPVDLYIALRKQNARSYTYAVPSGYLSLSSLATPLEIRTTRNPAIIFTKNDTSLIVNIKYSLFVTGLVSDNTRSTIFVTDTDAIPTVGRGKVRFINASARSANVDVYANGTLAFKNQGFKSVSRYLELTAGVYDLKIYAVNTTSVLADLPNTTIQDGRLYTLYTRGVVGRTDSAAFAAGLITNR